MATLWIGQDYLFKRSVIDNDAEFAKITPVITLVQRKYLLRILGTRLYNTLETHILAKINSSTAIPAAYLLLIDNYILDLLVYYIMYESSPSFKYRYTNKGIVVKNSENSQPASQSELEFQMNIWKVNAEMIGNELIDYLKANYATYPTYRTEIPGEVYPMNESYDVDIFLGDSKPRPRTNDADW
jgi:hypothetical protein